MTAVNPSSQAEGDIDVAKITESEPDVSHAEEFMHLVIMDI